jgi:hypothetical protein
MSLDLTQIIDKQSNFLGNFIPTDTYLTTDVNNLQRILTNVGNNVDTAKQHTSQILSDQGAILDIVNTENQRAQDKYDNVQDAIYGQKRMVLLNDSYRLRYVEYLKIILIIIITLFTIFIAYQLQPLVLIFFPLFLFEFFIFILFVLSLFSCFFIYNGILNRDSIDFNKLNLNIQNNVSTNHSIIPAPNVVPSNDLLSGTSACIGESCCGSNTSYTLISSNPDIYGCRPAPTPTPTNANN